MTDELLVTVMMGNGLIAVIAEWKITSQQASKQAAVPYQLLE